jgi:hypothetical protein
MGLSGVQSKEKTRQLKKTGWPTILKIDYKYNFETMERETGIEPATLSLEG